MVEFQWYDLHTFTSTKRTSRIATEYQPELYTLSSIVPIGATEPIKFDEVRGGFYFDLLETTHEKIMRYGNFD